MIEISKIIQLLKYKSFNYYYFSEKETKNCEYANGYII